MESFKPLQIFTFLFLAMVVASQADLDAYWKSKLPNSRMPKAVRDLLPNGGVNVQRGFSVNDAASGINYAASQDLLRYDPNVYPFFLQKDLHSGTAITLHFSASPHTSAAFLPREAADSIPFSSRSLNTVLSRFQIDPNSAEAKAMKTTIEECEAPAVKGEDKFCATSLESMVDFSTSKLGRNVEVISAQVQKDTEFPQEYKMVDVKKINGGNDAAVVCHRMNYAYAVFYCHAFKTTEAYAVGLLGADGTRAKAAAICHQDTAAWNPKHIAFQVLKVKPGSVPICHFLPRDHIVWVSK